MAFHHDAEDAALSRSDLFGHVLRHLKLLRVVLAAVGVAEIDHQFRRQAGGGQFLSGRVHACRVVIGRFSAAQNDVAVLVAIGGNDGRVATLGHGDEVVRMLRGLDGVDGDPDVAVSAVLEADGTGQAGSQFAVHLAFGRARADGTPAHEVGHILRRDDIEKFGARRQAQFIDLHQQTASDADSLVDLETAVQQGVIDQALPANRRARFFKIDPHDDNQIFGQLSFHNGKPSSIFHGRLGVVDRTGADDNHQPVVGAVQHTMNVTP